MGAVYSLLEVAYNTFYPQAVDSTSQTVERVHDDGDLDATDSASVTPTSTLGRTKREDVDKRNINVICTGKRVEVNVFPDERVASLLQDACEKLGKKPNFMCIVLNGEVLDVKKRIRDYNLRGGQTVHLIRGAPSIDLSD